MTIGRLMNKEDVVYIYCILLSITQPLKEWNDAISSNLDGSRGYH